MLASFVILSARHRRRLARLTFGADDHAHRHALAAVATWLGFKLVGISRFWALAFFALAIAALLGGTWHGFWQNDLLWKATTLPVGVASFGMVVGSARATTKGRVRQALSAFALLKLLAYTVWMIGHDDFIWVVADTAGCIGHRRPAAPLAAQWWMLAG